MPGGWTGLDWTELNTDCALARSLVIDTIKDALADSPELREDPAFRGLWEATSFTDEDEGDDHEQPQGDADHTQRSTPASIGRTRHRSTATPRKSGATATTAIDQAAEQALAVVQREIHHTDRALTRSVRSLARKSSTNLRQAAVKAKGTTERVVVHAQSNLSNAWTLSVVLLGLEISYLASAAVPWPIKVSTMMSFTICACHSDRCPCEFGLIKQTFGPHTWLTRGPTRAFSFTVPEMSVLWHPTFTSALFRWSLLNLICPLVVALLVAWPDRQQQRQQHVRRGTSRAEQQLVASPNVVTFSIARLAIVVLSGYVFGSASATSRSGGGFTGVANGGGRRWSFEAVEGYPAVSVVGAAVTLAFATFDATAA